MVFSDDENIPLLGKTPYVVTGICRRRRCHGTFITTRGSCKSRERFDLESPNFTRTFTAVGSITAPDMTSLVASSWLQNAIKYTHVLHKSDAQNGYGQPKSQIIRALFKPELITCCTDIPADLVYSDNGYDVISYFQSKFEKNSRKCPSDGFRSNFSSAAFCLPHQLVGVLIPCNAVIRGVSSGI